MQLNPGAQSSGYFEGSSSTSSNSSADSAGLTMEHLDATWPNAAVRDARPCSECADRWPLVIFSHGSGAFRANYIYWTEFLASHGFVVAACDHLGSARCTITHSRQVIFIDPLCCVLLGTPKLAGRWSSQVALALRKSRWSMIGLETFCSSSTRSRGCQKEPTHALLVLTCRTHDAVHRSQLFMFLGRIDTSKTALTGNLECTVWLGSLLRIDCCFARTTLLWH